jgi:hypothetical protein
LEKGGGVRHAPIDFRDDEPIVPSPLVARFDEAAAEGDPAVAGARGAASSNPTEAGAGWQKARQLKRTSLLSRVHRAPPKAVALKPELKPDPKPKSEPEIAPAEDPKPESLKNGAEGSAAPPPASAPAPAPAPTSKKKEKDAAAPPKKKGMMKSIYKAMIRSAFNKDKEAKPKKRPNMFTSPTKPK